jgi:hypothetical protein
LSEANAEAGADEGEAAGAPLKKNARSDVPQPKRSGSCLLHAHSLLAPARSDFFILTKPCS